MRLPRTNYLVTVCIFLVAGCLTAITNATTAKNNSGVPAQLTPGNFLLENDICWVEITPAGQIVQKIPFPKSPTQESQVSKVICTTLDDRGRIFALVQADADKQQLRVGIYDSVTGKSEFPEQLIVPSWEVEGKSSSPSSFNDAPKDLGQSFPGASDMIVVGETVVVANNQRNSWRFDMASGETYALPPASFVTKSLTPETIMLGFDRYEDKTQTLFIVREMNLSDGSLKTKYLLERGGSQILDPEGNFFGRGTSRVQFDSSHFRQSPDGTELASINLGQFQLEEKRLKVSGKRSESPAFGAVDIYQNQFVISCRNRKQLFFIDFDLDPDSIKIVRLEDDYYRVLSIKPVSN